MSTIETIETQRQAIALIESLMGAALTILKRQDEIQTAQRSILQAIGDLDSWRGGIDQYIVDIANFKMECRKRVHDLETAAVSTPDGEPIAIAKLKTTLGLDHLPDALRQLQERVEVLAREGDGLRDANLELREKITRIEEEAKQMDQTIANHEEKLDEIGDPDEIPSKSDLRDIARDNVDDAIREAIDAHEREYDHDTLDKVETRLDAVESAIKGARDAFGEID